MIVDDASKKKFIGGFGVYDGSIGSDNRLCFVLVENNDSGRSKLLATRFLFVRLENPIERRFWGLNWDIPSFTTVAWGSTDFHEFVMVNSQREVYAYNYNYAVREFEDDIDEFISGVDGISPSINKVVRVGKSVYAIGSPDRIYKRLGVNKWEDHVSNFDMPSGLYDKNKDVRLHTAIHARFWDLAGFSEQDMYVVGRNGSVCHYNGSKWERITFPADSDLLTVVCGGDDQVYITDNNCSVWVGRNSTWKKLVEEDMSLSFFDSAWFDDRMWFTNDYGLWVLESEKLVLAKDAQHKPVPEEAAILCGRLDVAHDNSRMLLCGQHGAAVYDGQNWEVLFNCDPE